MSTFHHLLKNQSTKMFILKAFLWGLSLSFIIFIPLIISDGGRFFFYGDFNVQQVPFYQLAHDAVRWGNFGWSDYTDLGANFIGSYSFYLLGSPFFWLTIPFPNDFLPYLMAPLLILKFGCASATSALFLKRYVKDLNYALIGGILYAFSGFSVYNVFFNHFHEAIVIFPLMLYALDEFVFNKRRGLFAIVVGLSCLANYYFFVGQVVFTLIYFFLRLITKSYKITVKEFLLLFLEAVLGFLTSMILLLPSILTITQNYRVSNPINGWNAVLYSSTQRYLHIITSFFFPPDLAARPNFTPDSGSKWASIGAWLPLFSMTGVIAFLRIRKRHWAKKLLFICILMALVPGLNSAFQMFNASYYARWFYMFTLITALATVLALEDRRADFKTSIKYTSIITICIAVAVGFTPDLNEVDGVETLTFGLYAYIERYWAYVAIALFSLAVLTYLFVYYRKDHEAFVKKTCIALSCITVFYGIYFMVSGKTQSSSPYDHIIPNLIDGREDLQVYSSDDARVDFYESLDNSGMYLKMHTIQAFHSIVPGSIMEYYDYVGVQRDVGSRPDVTEYAIRALTSVEYLFDEQYDSDYFSNEEDKDQPRMDGFEFVESVSGFDVYKNNYFISMGFTYEHYLTKSIADELTESQRQLAMLEALIIDDDMEESFTDLLTEYDTTSIRAHTFDYRAVCTEKALNTADSFEYTNTGFKAQTSFDNEEFIFFSVPYENGWSAKVNGESTEIYRVNIGFMSIKVPAGENVSIEFSYNTPGLDIGIIVTLSSVFAILIYIFLCNKLKPKTTAHKED